MVLVAVSDGVPEYDALKVKEIVIVIVFDFVWVIDSEGDSDNDCSSDKL
jgi:hypothetical protein